MSETFELSDLVQEAIAHEMHHPKTGEELGIRVVLLPITDAKIKALSRTLQDRKNYLAARNKTLKTEELEEFRVKLAITAMTSWEWYGPWKFNGKVPEFTPQNVKAVCEKFDWFLDEIDETLGDGKAFFID